MHSGLRPGYPSEYFSTVSALPARVSALPVRVFAPCDANTRTQTADTMCGYTTPGRAEEGAMAVWLEAGLWGLVAGAALLLGASLGWWLSVPPAVVAAVMAFGAGVLVSALAFDLVDEAERSGGLLATSAGFLLGACVYVAVNAMLSRRGARHRKRSAGRQPSDTRLGAAERRSPSAPCSTAYRKRSSSDCPSWAAARWGSPSSPPSSSPTFPRDCRVPRA